jgi:prepilin-type N-terminal cleavage/methylation domain-containing protein
MCINLRVRNGERRPGFTLVELLMVVFIIAVLVSLVASASMRFYYIQFEKNTESTIGKIDSALRRHWQKVIDQASEEPIPQPYRHHIVVDLAGWDDPKRVRVIWIKLRLKQQFPMSFAEALNPSPPAPATLPLSTTSVYVPPEPAYTRILNSHGVNNNNVTWPPQAYESSACLAMALSLARGGMATNVADFGSSSISAAPGTSIDYLIDAWKRPLAFYRWATNSDEVNQLYIPQPTQGLARRDPQDPDGKLLDLSWWHNSGANVFGDTIHPFSPNPNLPGGYTKPPNPTSVYTTPVIVSAGRDGVFGFFNTHPYCDNNPQLFLLPFGMPDPMAVADTNAASDNIYNIRLKLGGRGD